MTHLNFTHRSYQTEDDFWRMRAFLREVFVLNDYREVAWSVARLDYCRWHTALNCAGLTLDQTVTLWEQDGALAAILMPDGDIGEAHLMVHPAYRSAELEEAMLDVAEERLAKPQEDGTRRLFVWAHFNDTQRQAMLQRRGYARDDWPEHQHRLRIDDLPPIATLAAATGYTVRSLGDGVELIERCWASGRGFHEDDIQYAVKNRENVQWYRNIQNAPLYRRDLDLVAVAPDGAIGSFCTIWFDDVTRTAYFEPVATVPEHRRKGLAQALLTEGLARLQRMGCVYAFVGGYSQRANALYNSVFGSDCELDEVWVKVFPA